MYKLFFKRIIDFIITFSALSFLAPIFIILMIILAVVNRGSPFFLQGRPGKNEKIFKIIKFRSMNEKKDEKGRLLPDEQRLTKVGSFIRKTSLDEIPQLLNVLKGDMSIIGPRPLLIQYLPYYTERERLRHTVRPGITGLAQINGRNTLNWDERLEIDVKYVETLTFKRDIGILWMTFLNTIYQKDIVIVPGKALKKLDYYRK